MFTSSMLFSVLSVGAADDEDSWLLFVLFVSSLRSDVVEEPSGATKLCVTASAILNTFAFSFFKTEFLQTRTTNSKNPKIIFKIGFLKSGLSNISCFESKKIFDSVKKSLSCGSKVWRQSSSFTKKVIFHRIQIILFALVVFLSSESQSSALFLFPWKVTI